MYERIGLEFSQYRIDKGMTPLQIADQCGIPLASVNRIENGELGKVKIEHVVAACKLLGVSFNIKFVNRDEGDYDRREDGGD